MFTVHRRLKTFLLHIYVRNRKWKRLKTFPLFIIPNINHFYRHSPPLLYPRDIPPPFRPLDIHYPPASDIWWSSLETCSNLFSRGPARPLLPTSSGSHLRLASGRNASFWNAVLSPITREGNVFRSVYWNAVLLPTTREGGSGGHCNSRYASHWNAFSLQFFFYLTQFRRFLLPIKALIFFRIDTKYSCVILKIPIRFPVLKHLNCSITLAIVGYSKPNNMCQGKTKLIKGMGQNSSTVSTASR